MNERCKLARLSEFTMVNPVTSVSEASFDPMARPAQYELQILTCKDNQVHDTQELIARQAIKASSKTHCVAACDRAVDSGKSLAVHIPVETGTMIAAGSTPMLNTAERPAPEPTRELRVEMGRWLREARESEGLSQRNLARRLHLDYYTFISQLENGRGKIPSRCLIPRFDGAILSMEWKDALWDKFVMAAPRQRTPSEQQYSDRKLRSRS